MSPFHHEHIIVGAGPSGLQMAYYLDGAGRDYVILEATDSVGGFFRKFPRTQSLISFNRPPYPTDDEEFQWRGDWNSLLADDGPRFRDYDERLLPQADSMVTYLGDFATHHDLNIRFDCRIVSIEKTDEGFRLVSANGDVFVADHLLVGFGVAPHVPAIPGIEHVHEAYENASLDKEDYRDKRVMILGKRNSAFEIANIAQEAASIVLMVSPNPLVLAWNTKHSGHPRANLIGPLDTYQLKLVLTKLLDASVISIEPRDGKFLVSVAYTHAEGEVETFIVDKLINCTGFAMDVSVFAPGCKPEMVIDERFPKLTHTWESSNIPSLYFTGTIAQCNDTEKASSPFVAGFRYNIRSLFHLIEERYHGVPLPHDRPPVDPERLADWLVRRITRSAAIFFQFGYLGDVLVPEGDEFIYYRELPIAHVHERFGDRPFYLLVTFDWGDYQGDVFAIPRQPQAEHAHRSAFIHPILRAVREGEDVAEHHLLEDLFAVFSDEAHDSHYVLSRAGTSVSDWHAKHHVKPLTDFLEDVLEPYLVPLAETSPAPSGTTRGEAAI